MMAASQAAADPVGHYARPDVLRLMFNAQPNPRVMPFESEFAAEEGTPARRS